MCVDHKEIAKIFKLSMARLICKFSAWHVKNLSDTGTEKNKIIK